MLIIADKTGKVIITSSIESKDFLDSFLDINKLKSEDVQVVKSDDIRVATHEYTVQNENLVFGELLPEPIPESNPEQEPSIKIETLTTKVDEIEHRISTASEKYDSLDKIGTSLEDLKSSRILKLKEECSNAIYEGFTSGVNTFGFNEQDQVNFTQQLLLIVSGFTGDIQWKTKNNGVQTFAIAEFRIIASDATEHKIEQQQKYWEKELLILNANTNEEVNAVIW